MPEGKKKDSFTFSDKIKNSKPAGSKSFANRIFAKIGKDGKPRQTLYERTRRDAPFFIAAVIALLLLPFLYKYSGSVGDDNEISPITGDLMQDPDSRDGYYSFVDSGNSALAPYPGNDTALLLVKPYAGEDSGAITEEQVPDVYTPSYDSEKRDSYADTSAQKKSSKLRDKETNILNEYRKRAAATTRKAFKRTPTKINSLGTAGLRRPGGSKLGVNMWGGGLKKAADKVKGSPTEGTKPVSLQPLVAAGKPSRSSFGQGPLAAAQKSKDAMSKSNPIEALRDAQFRPLDNHRAGGMDFDRNPFGPGGGGQLKRDFKYEPKEPWWWDMTKTRMQKQWERMFDYKWGWIDWGTDLLRHWLGGLLNCLVTGNEDGDMGTMFGTSGGSGDKEATCCGTKISYLRNGNKGLSESYSDDEKFCKALKGNKPEICPNGGGFKAGRTYATSGTGWWATRKSCFGVSSRGTAGVHFDSGTSCALFNASNGSAWYLDAEGEATKWHKYIYVLADNKMPPLVDAHVHSEKLCGYQNSALKRNASSGTASSNGQITQHITSTNTSAHNERNSALDKCVIDVQSFAKNARASFNYNDMQLRQEELFAALLSKSKQDAGCSKEKPICTACKGRVCNCANTADKCATVREAARLAFNQLSLYRVEGMVSKHYLAQGTDDLRGRSEQAKKDYDAAQKAYNEANEILAESSKSATGVAFEFPGLQSARNNAADATERLENAKAAYMTVLKDALPMPYLMFKEAYIARRGMSSSPNNSHHTAGREIIEWSGFNGTKNRLDLSKAKARVEGEDRFWGDDNAPYGDFGCDWVNRVSISCTDVDNPAATKATATLTFVTLNRNTSGYNMKNINVQAQLNIEGEAATNITSDLPIGSPISVSTDVISQDVTLDFGKFTTSADKNESFNGFVTWVVKDQGNTVQLDSARCAFNATAETKHESTQEESETEETEETEDESDDQKENTYLAKRISIVPDNYKGREPSQEYSENKFKDPKLVPNATTSQHCLDSKPLGINNTKAKLFVEDVIKKYNEQNPDANLDYVGLSYKDDPEHTKYPTTGEMVDALNIAKALGIQSVPKSAVCALARNMVRMSEDVHVQGWHNDLGAFLAYINDASILYPAKYTNRDGKKVCDRRFLSIHASSSGCNDARTNMNLNFHYANYNLASCAKPTCNPRYTGESRYNKYLASLKKHGMTTFPLADLVSHKGSWNLTRELQADDAHKFVEEYNAPGNGRRSYSGLLVDPNPEEFGQACEAFYAGQGNPVMPVAKALEYVKQVCKTGLNEKPNGQGKDNKPDPGAQVNSNSNNTNGDHQVGQDAQ